jgi:DNA-binding CsgD family transcriptional regulator
MNSICCYPVLGFWWYGADMLSPIQIEILEHIALGRTNRQIAKAMSYSEQAIKYHVTWILRKLDANCRAHAVAAAIEHGLLDAKVSGNRRLIVEGLADSRHRSNETLYAELAQQIFALKEEVARLTEQLQSGAELAEVDLAEVPVRSGDDDGHVISGLE